MDFTSDQLRGDEDYKKQRFLLELCRPIKQTAPCDKNKAKPYLFNPSASYSWSLEVSVDDLFSTTVATTRVKVTTADITTNHYGQKLRRVLHVCHMT